MIKTDLWHEAAIDELIAVMRTDKAVRALILTGSFAQPHLDKDVWSDIDAVVIVDDAALDRFYPNTDWLKPLGELFAVDQSVHPNWFTTRACFTDMRRMDFGIIRESALQQMGDWGNTPFWIGFRVYSRALPLWIRHSSASQNDQNLMPLKWTNFSH